MALIQLLRDAERLGILDVLEFTWVICWPGGKFVVAMIFCCIQVEVVRESHFFEELFGSSSWSNMEQVYMSFSRDPTYSVQAPQGQSEPQSREPVVASAHAKLRRIGPYKVTPVSSTL